MWIAYIRNKKHIHAIISEQEWQSGLIDKLLLQGSVVPAQDNIFVSLILFLFST